LWEEPFANKEWDTSSKYERLLMATGLFKEYHLKKALIQIGESNAGKGVKTNAFQNTFQNYIGTFNITSLVYNSNSGSDSAKQLSFLLSIYDKRISFSSEASTSCVLDANLYKNIVSGGDRILARSNFKDEKEIVNTSLLISCMNAMPRIEPIDDAVVNRLEMVQYKNIFVANPTPDTNERKRDENIKSVLNQQKYKDALCHIMFESYSEWISNGFPDDPNSQTFKESILSEFTIKGTINKNFEITKNHNDFVPYNEIKNFLKREGKTPTDNSLSIELTKIGLKKIQQKRFKDIFSGKDKIAVVYTGIKRLNEYLTDTPAINQWVSKKNNDESEEIKNNIYDDVVIDSEDEV
jgi:hypothetical protein